VNLNCRFEPEDTPLIRLRLKIDINTTEHFTERGVEQYPVKVENPRFSGEAEVTSLSLPELLGTKPRAPYQRKKGRDLFDLWFAIAQRGDLDLVDLLRCFHRYMREGGHRVSRTQFEENLHRKGEDPDSHADVKPLLRPTIDGDFDRAMVAVREQLVERLPGHSWAGRP
jgi:hypothetical protein